MGTEPTPSTATKRRRRTPLTAREFFARGLPGASVTDAHFATRISLTTLNEYVDEKRRLNVATANKLQEWSAALKKCPAYIAAGRTVGVLKELP